MSLLELEVATDDILSVRRFVVREAISETFEVTVLARSPDASRTGPRCSSRRPRVRSRIA